MRPIPQKIRKRLANDSKMTMCTLCGSKNNLEWHHALTYNGTQLNEWFAILALCRECHRGDFGTIKLEARILCELLAMTRGLSELQKKYPKRNWTQEKQWREQQIKKFMLDKKI